MIISSHLENNLEQYVKSSLYILATTHVNDSSQKHAFLRCAYHLLCFCPVVGASLGINRLLKATIIILSPLYLHQSRTETSLGATNQSRASKKRRREYEADNVLSATKTMVCATTAECDTLIAALDGEHLDIYSDIWLLINLPSCASMYVEYRTCSFHSLPCEPSAPIHPTVTPFNTTFMSFTRS